MGKYIVYFKSVIIAQMAFRFQFFVEYLSQFIIILVKIFLWESIIASNSSNKVIEVNQVITYFILAGIISQITDISLEFANKIRTGMLSNDLIKPVNAVGLEFTKVIALKILTIIKFLPVFIVLILIFNKNFLIPNFNFYSLVFLITGIIISFYIQLFIHTLAFWMTDVSSMNYIVVIFIGIFSGNLIPYQFLPEYIKNIFELLPFQFFINAPISTMIGHLSVTNFNNYLAVGMIYIFAFSILNYFLFKLGVRKYTAVGG